MKKKEKEQKQDPAGDQVWRMIALLLCPATKTSQCREDWGSQPLTKQQLGGISSTSSLSCTINSRRAHYRVSFNKIGHSASPYAVTER